MADSSLLSHSCSSLRLPDMLTVPHQYSTACVMFGNWATVERRRSGGQSEREKRAEDFPAHVVRILTALLVRRSCILGQPGLAGSLGGKHVGTPIIWRRGNKTIWAR